MREHTITVYKLNELGTVAKARALRKLYEKYADDFWYDSTLDYWTTELLPGQGFNNADINFDINCGACFKADIDLTKFYALPLQDVTATMVTHHNIGMHCNIEDCTDELTLDQVKKLELIIEAKARELSDEIFGELRAEHDYLESEEYWQEFCDNNDIEFYAIGSIL